MAHLKSGMKRMSCQLPLWHVKFDAKVLCTGIFRECKTQWFAMMFKVK
jgi:hypothetical protein